MKKKAKKNPSSQPKQKRDFRWLTGELAYELHEGVHTVHRCSCHRGNWTRGGKCYVCVIEELDKVIAKEGVKIKISQLTDSSVCSHTTTSVRVNTTSEEKVGNNLQDLISIMRADANYLESLLDAARSNEASKQPSFELVERPS